VSIRWLGKPALRALPRDLSCFAASLSVASPCTTYDTMQRGRPEIRSRPLIRHLESSCRLQKTAGRARSNSLYVAHPRYILNQMVQYASTVLDASFAALSDATRRGVLEQLGRADASISDLAEKFHMTLTGMKKHVGVLEQAGLVATEKVGRVRTCKLGRRGLATEAAWIERQRQLWAARFNELDKLVEELKQKEKADVRNKR
jgi:DNA-binding transcriptional ArsR family regulator